MRQIFYYSESPTPTQPGSQTLSPNGQKLSLSFYREAAAEKAAEAERKKAEKAAILAEEEKNARAVPKGANKKTAEKKSKGTLNLDQLDQPSESKRAPALNATGIDNALDALDITSNDNSTKIDRHPERRFKAAYKAYEERRLPEIKLEHPGLRENQRKDIIRKEFEKSEENPFNQANVISYDANKEAIKERKEEVKRGIEGRLAEK